MEKTKNNFTPQPVISPSSINTYCKCPRSYFYNYICKLYQPPNIHLIKGILVHKALEDFFRFYKPNLDEQMANAFIKAWQSSEKAIKKLELTPEEILVERRDCSFMVAEYLTNFKRKIRMLMESGKAENEAHAYYLLKPKFKELKVEDKDLKCKGFIDRIHEGYDGAITIGDYKTSKKFGIGITEDYKRQISIYALLYKLQEKKTPDFTSVIFLRYGEEFLLEVTPSLLRYARDTIRDVYSKTRSVAKEDYPKKESNLCRWCSFSNICDGTEDWESKLRTAKLKEIFKK